MVSSGRASGPVEWIHLVDPDEAQVRDVLPPSIHRATVERMAAPPNPSREPRPRLDSHGDHIVGVLIVAVDIDSPTNEPPADNGPSADSVYFQEVHVVVTPDLVVTVAKTPPGGEPFDVSAVQRVCERTECGGGAALFHLVDEVAERYLDLVDALNEEIDVLEDNVMAWSATQIRNNLSTLRHDVLHIRRALAPTRDAARRVLDDRIELDDHELFPREVELQFADAYDKLLRAVDGLDLSRDLIAGVRDFHQAQVANDQNEVMKRLTAIASILLLPTFIVGLYGQNLHGGPEFHWAQGYWFSWGLIIVTTIAQVAYFRRKRWI
jgi:magnesium transporter